MFQIIELAIIAEIEQDPSPLRQPTFIQLSGLSSIKYLRSFKRRYRLI